LKEVTVEQVPLRERERFYNVPNDGTTKASIRQDLNACIEILRNAYPHLNIPYAEMDMSSGATNQLHHFFEILRGSIVKPSSQFMNADSFVRDAIERLNLLIHKYEDFVHFGAKDSTRVVCTWQVDRRRALDEEDYKHFTISRQFGTLYINYCEVGKHLMECFYDNDHAIISPEGIRPLKFYSPDLYIWLGRDFTQDETERLKSDFDKWWDEVNLSRHGFIKEDPKNALGLIPVADLIRDGDGQLSPADLKAQLVHHKFIQSVRYEAT